MEEAFSRRLLLPDVRGPHRYLRVTWHRETATVVWSHWQDGVCVASTPVSLEDATKLIALIVGALKDAALNPITSSLSCGADRGGGWFGRLRERLQPQLAQVVELYDRFWNDVSPGEPGRA